MSTKCKICDDEFENVKEFDAHKETAQHRLNFIKYFLEKNKDEWISDKFGIRVGCLEHFNCIPELKLTSSPGATKDINFYIENSGDTVLFLQCEFLHKMPCRCVITDVQGVSAKGKTLRMLQGDTTKYCVNVCVTTPDVGIYRSPLVFQFKRQDQPAFYIVRYLEVTCQNSITESLRPSEPYNPSSVYYGLPEAKTIITFDKRGRKDGRRPKQTVVRQLAPVRISKSDTISIEEIQNANRRNQRPNKFRNSFANDIMTMLKMGIDEEIYGIILRVLLNFEIIQMKYDIRKYDMESVIMSRSGKNPNNLQLYVPGLSENRPSVMRNDSLFVRIVEEKFSRDVEYEGSVVDIDESYVHLGFSQILMMKYLNGMRFDVRFQVNDFPQKAMHRALNDIKPDQTKTLLFPKWTNTASCPVLFNPTDQLVFYNRKITENPEQAVAIKHIVAGSSLPSPYLLHGPPGTGKTVTLVEAVKQIWKKYSTPPNVAYVLFCAPSNSAADLVTERLLEHLDGSQLLRFYARSRDWKTVPEKIKNARCTNYVQEEQAFETPSLEKVLTYRVIIATLINSTKLITLGVGKDHFTHVFIDEAGHAVEPETIIPISGLLNPRLPNQKGFGGQLVLTGDPKQLGPVIRCKVAEKYGLGTSLLERLMNQCEVYQKIGDRFDPRVLTRLLHNYRSHPDILKLPNEIFYENELKVFANQLDRESLSHWQSLPNPGFPLLFHGVLGKDVREGKSPSYFNAEEVAVVVGYVEKLIQTRRLRITQKEIGVISPYRQQVCKIKAHLKKKNYDQVSVGSVDEFQGQERRVIIITTVRSNTDLMAYDEQFKLGFVKNPKRFNVAITRAKCLLIIVGNPKLLSLDKHWKELLMYCFRAPSYVGVFYDPPEEEMEELQQRLSKLGFLPNMNEEVDIKISKRAQQEDPQWRSDY